MLAAIKEQLPVEARDIRINLDKVLDVNQPDGLSSRQIYGCALAVACHLGNTQMSRAIAGLCADDSLFAAAKLAASLMAMTNIYYRFIHLVDIAELGQIPAGLRMQGMVNPGIDRTTFEMMSLAVSIVNGCGACITAHSQHLLHEGLSIHALARIGRISAVLHATHVSLKISAWEEDNISA